MGAGKGRRTAVIAVSGCLGTLLACLPLLKDLLVEEWRLRELGAKDTSEAVAAAAALGEAGSLRAIPGLLELLRGRIRVEERPPLEMLNYSLPTARLWDAVTGKELESVPLCLCGDGSRVSGYLNQTVFNALERIGEKRGATAASALLRTLEAEPPGSPLLPVLVSLLGRIGPEARGALPTLESLRTSSKSTDPILWHLAVDAVWAIQ